MVGCELSDAHWFRIAPLLPGKVGDPGLIGRRPSPAQLAIAGQPSSVCHQ